MVKKYLLNRSIRTFIKAKNNRNSKGFIRKICTKCHNVQCIKWCPSDLMYQSIIMQFLKKIVNNYSLFLFCYLSVEIEIYQNRYWSIFLAEEHRSIYSFFRTFVSRPKHGTTCPKIRTTSSNVRTALLNLGQRVPNLGQSVPTLRTSCPKFWTS